VRHQETVLEGENTEGRVPQTAIPVLCEESWLFSAGGELRDAARNKGNLYSAHAITRWDCKTPFSAYFVGLYLAP
jgi:hypothetical protein